MSEAAAQSGFRSIPIVAGMLSDDRLAERAAAGDERAFSAIFDRYHQRLYRYCLATTGNAEDAQDALQNTMVKVLRALPGEERKIELKPWLYRIAHNESIELLRRRRDTPRLDDELPAPGTGLADEAASRERLRQLISDLDQLPERQRGALVMRELSGLDFAEIAAALGTSQAVARQTLYEARLSLRQMDEGREMSCEAVTKALSDGDGRVLRRRDLRAHLRTCASCRAFREEIESRERDLAALSPLPAVAAAGLLQALLGGHGGGGGGLAIALGGGASKSLGASVALKGAATVAVVAAIGVGAADRGGLVDVGASGGSDSQAGRPELPAAAGSAPAPQAQAASAAVGAGTASASAAESAGAKRAVDLGAPHTVEHDAETTSRREEADTEAAPAPASQGNSVAHSHGKGHEKQLPSASAHGQQTAESHKAAEHGSAGAQGHPAHPAKPPHPVHPSTPSTEKEPSVPSGAAAPEAQSHGNGNGNGNAATPPAGVEETTPPGHETGKP